MADPSDEVADHEALMRVRTLQANIACLHLRVELILLDCVAAITPMLHELAILHQWWEIEQRDAWAIAQHDPEAWLDRIVQG